MFTRAINKIPILLSFVGVYSIFLFLSSSVSYAQTCGGSAGFLCANNGYYTKAACTTDASTGYQYCDQYSVSVSSYTCLSNGGGINNGCYACVPTDQSCNFNSIYGYYFVCDPYGNCSTQPEGLCGSITSQTPSTGTMCGQNGNIHYQACSNGCTAYCNTGTANCSACNASAPTNRCGTFGGSQTCQHNAPQTCTATSFSQGCSQFIDNCSNNYSCANGNTCVTNIYIHVYTDYNHGGTKDGNDAAKSGVTVTDNGGNSPTTDANGLVTFSGKTTGNYTIGMTTPTNFAVTSSTATTNSGTNNNTASSPSNSVSFNLGNGNGNENVNFYVTPLYTISGYVYSDGNKDQKKDGSETGLSGMSVALSGNGVNTTVTTDANGYYTFSNLEASSYTVSVTSSLAAGYEYTTPYSWSVTVGDPAGSPACSTSSSLDALCGGQNNGSLSNVNIGATNENSHYNGVCLDIRTDNSGGGTISDPMPAPGATCGGQNGSQAILNNGTCSTGSGIVYSCNGTFDFGLGTSDANTWTAGGTATQDSECYSGPGLDVIPTAYNYLMTTAKESNITPTNLDNTQNPDPTTSCTTTDCTLPASLPKGIYQVNGSLTLHAGSYTFPAPADPTNNSQAYIILVNGDLHIQGNIYVPQGSVVVFSVSGNIYVDKSVGNAVTDPTSSTVNAPDLEGIYSSDHNFTAESYGSGTAICNPDGTPLDNRLVILGVVITNASKEGGSFVNSRDLCMYDTSCSTIQTGGGTDPVDQGNPIRYILDLIADGQFLSTKNFNWSEVKP